MALWLPAVLFVYKVIGNNEIDFYTSYTNTITLLCQSASMVLNHQHYNTYTDSKQNLKKQAN